MNLVILLKLLRNLEQLRRREHWQRAQLEAYQRRALSDLREYAYARSPFYQKFHRGLTDRPLTEIPVLTKAMLMEHFDDLVTDRAIHLEAAREHMMHMSEASSEDADEPGKHGGSSVSKQAHPLKDQRFLGRYWVNATSGSSGHPGIFLFDDSEWAAILASFARGQEWSGINVSLTHQTRMASVASIDPWHMSAQVGATVGSWWRPTLRLAANEPLGSIVESLNAWQPEMLISYASMARILANEQLAGQLRIAPSAVFTSSEVLTDETRRLVEQAWGKPPFNQYAATETGGIAAECQQHHGMHVFEDLMILEVVDDHNRPVPTGTYGDKALVTVLCSHTQPLIRYELDDSLRLSSGGAEAAEGSSRGGRCGLPFALIDGIQGRVEDILYFPSRSADGDGAGKVAVHPNTFHRVMDIAMASGWQIVQEADGGVSILLSGGPNSAGDISEHAGRDGARAEDDALVERLATALTAQGAAFPYIKVLHVPNIPKTPAGKAPLIKNSSHR